MVETRPAEHDIAGGPDTRPAPAWIDASEAVKPDKPGDRMRAALILPGATYAQRNILALLAFHDGPGGCSPRTSTLARDLRVARSTIFEHYSALEGMDILYRQQRRGASRYKLNWAAILSGNPGQLNGSKPSGNPGQFSDPIPSGNPELQPSGNPGQLNRKEQESEREAASAAPLSPQAGRGGARRADLASGNTEATRARPPPAGNAPGGRALRNAEAQRRRDREPEDEYDRRDPDRREYQARAYRGETTLAEDLQATLERERQLLDTWTRAGRADKADQARNRIARLERQLEGLGKGGRGASEAEDTTERPNA